MTDRVTTSENALGAGHPRRGSWVMGDPVDAPDQAPASNPAGLVVLLGLLGFLYFSAGPRYFVVVIGLIVMIFLHELGHFMTARWTGMKATQFFLGMGPRIWSFHRGEVEYGVRAIPAGAFVRIIGMNNLDPIDAQRRTPGLQEQVLLETNGRDHRRIDDALRAGHRAVHRRGVGDRACRVQENWTIGEISQLETGETPAVEAGLELGDTILAVDGVAIPTFGTIFAIKLADRAGEEVTLDIRKADGSRSSRRR